MSDETIELRPQPFTPRCDEAGVPHSRLFPYQPVKDTCSLCPARCCRFNVKVSLPDALHYCRTLQVPFFAGLTIVPSEDPEHAFALDADPRFDAKGKPWPGRAELQLVRREEGTCAGLVQVGEHERCGVYEARPSFCRTYPAAWRTETKEGGPVSVLCPVPYAIDPETEARLRTHIARSVEFWGLHDEIVAAWNAEDHPRTVRAFLEYALPRTAERLSVELGATLAEGTRDQRLYDAMLASKVVPAPKVQLAPDPPRPFADLWDK